MGAQVGGKEYPGFDVYTGKQRLEGRTMENEGIRKKITLRLPMPPRDRASTQRREQTKASTANGVERGA